MEGILQAPNMSMKPVQIRGDLPSQLVLAGFLPSTIPIHFSLLKQPHLHTGAQRVRPKLIHTAVFQCGKKNAEWFGKQKKQYIGVS